MFVGVLQRLVALQGAKASISTEDNLIKDRNKRMCGGRCGDVLGHPQSHFICDHITTFGNGFKVWKSAHYDVDKVGFAGAWCVLTRCGEKARRRVDVVFDSTGLYGCTEDGFPLDEGDGIAGKEVVL